jgi:hypothetical protein
MTTAEPPPRVVISYTHDSPAHAERVLALADRLRADRLDAEVDQYEPHPPEGWRNWMHRQIARADFVLLVCTPTRRRRFEGREEPGVGLGAQRETALIDPELYERAGRNERFIPVLLDIALRGEALPDVLRDATPYVAGDEAGYVALLRRLTRQPEVTRPPVRAAPWPRASAAATSPRRACA